MYKATSKVEPTQDSFLIEFVVCYCSYMKRLSSIHCTAVNYFCGQVMLDTLKHKSHKTVDISLTLTVTVPILEPNSPATIANDAVSAAAPPIAITTRRRKQKTTKTTPLGNIDTNLSRGRDEGHKLFTISSPKID